MRRKTADPNRIDVFLMILVGMLVLFVVGCVQMDPSATSRETSRNPADAGQFPFALALEPVVTVANQLTYLTHAGDGSDRLFLVEKQGRVLVLEDGSVRSQPFLDISSMVRSAANEQGLLSIAFAPDYEQTGYFYVNYTTEVTADLDAGATVVARYRVSDDDANVADPASAQTILAIEQPYGNHNGGQMHFGPDGYLYIGTGDGGSGGDPHDNAENLSTLLGKLLRIDVSGALPYSVPSDNPFVDQPDARDELWAYGLRNPWRFSFDSETGDHYVADVGQRDWEEVNFRPADSAGGEHYGWDTMEGTHCFEPSSGCDTSGKVLPVAEYNHDLGCSVTGGYVYRGTRYPAMQGVYFFADYCSGRIWGLRRIDGGDFENEMLLDTDVNVASFGEDQFCELYVVGLGGGVYRLAVDEASAPTPTAGPSIDETMYLSLIAKSAAHCDGE